jgi:hypothetical protein
LRDDLPVEPTGRPSARQESVVVPDVVGMQALNAWLLGHEAGVLLQGPDPDAAEPLLHGVVVRQRPSAGSRVERWDPVTVWIRPPDPGAGAREPRRPAPDPLRQAAERNLDADRNLDDERNLEAERNLDDER